MTIDRKSAVRGEGAFGAIVGIVILVLVGMVLFKVVPVHVAGNDVLDAMNEAANFASVKPDDKLRYDIFSRAQKAGVPLPITEIKITRPGQAVNISAKYTQVVDIFGYKYTYRFEHTVDKPTF